MTRETIDDAIDRVAGELTAAAADAAFVARLRLRLERGPRVPVGWRAIGVAIAVVLLAVLASLFRSDTSVPRVPADSLTANDVPHAPTVASAEAAVPDLMTATAPVTPRAPDTRRIVEPPVDPHAIAALPAQRVLDVAHLQLEPLSVSPVDLSSLEITGLSMNDPGSIEEPKE